MFVYIASWIELCPLPSTTLLTLMNRSALLVELGGDFLSLPPRFTGVEVFSRNSASRRYDFVGSLPSIDMIESSLFTHGLSIDGESFDFLLPLLCLGVDRLGVFPPPWLDSPDFLEDGLLPLPSTCGIVLFSRACKAK